VAEFLESFIVLPPGAALTAAAWVAAAHCIGVGDDKGPFDQFPLLALVSPEKRCGK